jgi:hypothetical protein
MHYDEIDQLRTHHAAWSLLRSPHAPLVLSFLGRVFVDGNSGGQPAGMLAGQLDDELYALNSRLGEYTFPRSAAAYLDEWAAPDKAWLRKYYPPGTDEPHFDLTPPVEQALLWVTDLRTREFVGTESRLNTLFELLRQMVFGADADPERRLTELRRRRADLDAEIARAKRGEVDLLDPVRQRDRYYQFTRNARELLADFRAVEENFRGLDRQLRERIAGWTGTKGELLDDVLTSRSSIAESDQGRSFQALYDFLLSHQRQTELADLLDRLAAIEAIGKPDARLASIHYDWIEAGERTQGTVRLLSEQLRRFLDDQVWLENRRVFDLLRSIEATALALRHAPPPPDPMAIDDIALTVGLPFERPLYTPRAEIEIDSAEISAGTADFDADALLDLIYVDREELIDTVRGALRGRDQVGLDQVVAGQPLRQGLAELVGYLSLSDPTFAVVFDAAERDQITWEKEESTVVADVPTVVFAAGPGERP